MPDTGQHTVPELSYPFPENVDPILVILLKLHPGRVLPYERLMGMCRWMGSYFHDWIDYNGVAFSIEIIITRMGSHIF